MSREDDEQTDKRVKAHAINAVTMLENIHVRFVASGDDELVAAIRTRLGIVLRKMAELSAHGNERG